MGVQYRFTQSIKQICFTCHYDDLRERCRYLDESCLAFVLGDAVFKSRNRRAQIRTGADTICCEFTMLIRTCVVANSIKVDVGQANVRGRRSSLKRAMKVLLLLLVVVVTALAVRAEADPVIPPLPALSAEASDETSADVFSQEDASDDDVDSSEDDQPSSADESEDEDDSSHVKLLSQVAIDAPPAVGDEDDADDNR